jgi:hypothetical protein
MDDEDIRVLLARLARPHASGGRVVERADLLAAGPDFVSIMAWINDHSGVPDTAVASAPRRGLHGGPLHDGGGERSATPLRYVVPAAALLSS